MTTADENIRGEFESEVLKADGHVGKLPCKTYSDPITASAWWAWQASAAQYSERIKELEQQNEQLQKTLAVRDKQIGAYQSAWDEKDLHKQLSGIAFEQAHGAQFEHAYEQLQAQVAMLRSQTKQLVECLHDVATGQDGWAYQEVISEAQDVMADTTQTAEAYKRSVQAEALEKASNKCSMIADANLYRYGKGADKCAEELRHMAAELKEGE